MATYFLQKEKKSTFIYSIDGQKVKLLTQFSGSKQSAMGAFWDEETQGKLPFVVCQKKEKLYFWSPKNLDLQACIATLKPKTNWKIFSGICPRILLATERDDRKLNLTFLDPPLSQEGDFQKSRCTLM